MAAAGQEMTFARHQAGMQIKSWHAAQTPDSRSSLMFVLGDHDNWSGKAFGQPAGHNADHTGMPATIRKNQRRIVFRIKLFLGLLEGSQLDTAFLRLALFIEFVNVVGEANGPLRIGCDEHFDANRSLSEPTGRIQSRREPKAHVLAFKVRFLVELCQFEQTRNARPPPQAQAFQTVLDNDSVFIEQRNNVCNGTQGRQSERTQQHLAQPGRNLLGAAGTRRNRPRQFKGHAGTAQFAERILGARQTRMHKHVGLR